MLWPEHADAWRVFTGCSTQWRRVFVGMAGHAIWDGLRYDAVEIVMGRYGVAPADGDRVFGEVQVLESEFLRVKNGG